jgi:thiamine kinase-like enzyme
MHDTPADLPESQELPWLNTVLSARFPDMQPAQLHWERFGAAYGFASSIYRVRWAVDGRTRTAVVKTWQVNAPADLNEIHFYQNFPEPGVRLPTCYATSVSADGRRAVLVLEDLGNTIQGDDLEQMDEKRARLLAQGLAHLHASWLEHPRLSGFDWLPDRSVWDPEPDWFQDRRALFLTRFPEQLTGLPRRLLAQLEAAPLHANARLAGTPRTLLHGDLHLDNLRFDAQDKPILLDWANPISGPPALNLGELLFRMAPRQTYEAVLESYLQAFNRRASHNTSRRDLERALGGALLRQFARSTLGMARWQPATPRQAALIQVSLQRACAAVAFWQTRDPALFQFLD